MDSSPRLSNARYARRLRPSLAWDVHDALFSFWRLPRGEKTALETLVPRFSTVSDIHGAIGACLDWAGFVRGVLSNDDTTKPFDTRPIHVAWTLARHAECAFDQLIAPRLCERDVVFATDTTLVHGAAVRRLVACLGRERGDFYMAFLGLITVLEKALYDLYHQEQQRKTGAVETKKKNMILRDLLHSSVLESALPSGMVALLKILFLPSGLNLRNLVWHGFLVPAQFPRCFACLTTMLLLELPRYSTEDHSPVESSTLFQLHQFDERFQVPAELKDAMAKVYTANEGLGSVVLPNAETSLFIPAGRHRLVHRAFQALSTDGDELWFLFALLPVLEHAIRIQFVRCNTEFHGLKSLDDFSVAQIDQYYSTLDGFGQRDKHQVLLHSEIAGLDDPTKLNALYRTMPRAAMAVGLDLFMMATGPNVRAKLCHGEADLSTLLACRDPTTKKNISVITQLVLLAWISLCHAYPQVPDRSLASDAKRPRLTERPAVVELFEDAMGSSFHPFVQLRRLADSCETRFAAFEEVRSRWAQVRVTQLAAQADNGEEFSRLEFLASPTPCSSVSDDVLLAIIDKSSRICDFAWCYDPIEPPPAPVKKPKTFVEYLAILQHKLTDVTRQLDAHNALGSHLAVERNAASASVAQIERCLLALSDADGLSVSACMMDILTSIDRSLASFEARLATLAGLIQDGSARTSQRRAFLNNVFLLPVFESVQQLAFQLVRHQIRHLEAIATRRAELLEGSTSLELCPDARKFEQLQRKLLQFITAFEGCTGSSDGAQKSSEKALQLAVQFLESKAMRAVLI